jgi:two-component system alkaline phosphatase synthesis response regulator PhoP
MTMAVILVIDDDPMLLQMVQLMFERAHHTVVTTINPTKGIEIALRDLPDAIVVDDRMPQLSGSEVCRELKMDPLTTNIPVVMIGANYEIEKHAQEAGADGWIGKPFYPAELITIVESQLSKN